MKVIITGNARSGTSFLTNLVHKMTNYKCGSNLRSGNVHNKFGYWEHIDLNNITNKALKSAGISYVTYNSVPKINFSDKKFDVFRKKIKNIVDKEKIELYKDNKLILAPNLYTKLYPEAKWIYIQRNMEDSFKSKFGKKMSFDEYNKMVKNRLDCWESKKISKECLTINYEDFEKDIETVITKIADYLNVTNHDLNELKKVYRDKNNR